MMISMRLLLTYLLRFLWLSGILLTLYTLKRLEIFSWKKHMGS